MRYSPAMTLSLRLLSAMLPLCGCHLIDQHDIDPKPPVMAAPPPVPDPETRKALVTIEYATANPEFRPPLAAAIGAAEARRTDLLYDVVAVIGQAKEAEGARLRAADVMTAIEADGVQAWRVQLGLRIEPGRKTQQVRVYLR